MCVRYVYFAKDSMSIRCVNVESEWSLIQIDLAKKEPTSESSELTIRIDFSYL